MSFQRAKTKRLNRPSPGTLRVWTIQSWHVWEELQKYGRLYVDPGLVDNQDLIGDSYEWMREQMSRRLSHYEGQYPWWGWHKPKPDLRKPSSFPQGIRGNYYVRLELAIPTENVLLLSDEGWLWALNHFYLAYTDREKDDWEAELEQAGFGKSILFEHQLPEPWRSRLEVSWERIFDLRGLAAGDICPYAERYVQAVFERLELKNVIAATEYTARRCTEY